MHRALIALTAFIPALAVGAPEAIGVLSVADGPASADLVELTRALQAAIAERVLGVVAPEELARRMAGPAPSASLAELEQAYASAAATYQAGSFRPALRSLQATLRSVEELPESPEAFDLWTRVVLRLARSEAALGLKDESAALLGRLLHADPAAKVDGRKYPPSFVAQVEARRAALQAEPHRRLVVTADRRARIFVEGRDVGDAPATLSLPRGRYRVTAVAGPARLRTTAVLLERDEALALDLGAAAAFRADAGPGLALPSPAPVTDVTRAGAALTLDRVVAVTGSTAGPPRFLAGALYDVRRGVLLREGYLRGADGPPAPEAIAALATFLVRGETSDLVISGAPPPIPRPGRGELILHFHLDDGRYDDLRLVTWPAVVGSLRERQFTWSNVPGSAFPGALPSGRDAFGPFWRVPIAAEGERINFIPKWGAGYPSTLGLPAENYACDAGPVPFWLLADGDEVWVKGPGCERFATREAAEGADRVRGGPAAEGARPFVLHYRRRDGQYEGLRLVVWPSHAAPSELREAEPGLSCVDVRLSGLPPTGKDAFGVYWRLPAEAAPTARLDFQVRRSHCWDECNAELTSLGHALFWILSDGPEAWVDVPGCELFPSLEQAERAAARR